MPIYVKSYKHIKFKLSCHIKYFSATTLYHYNKTARRAQQLFAQQFFKDSRRLYPISISKNLKIVIFATYTKEICSKACDIMIYKRQIIENLYSCKKNRKDTACLLCIHILCTHLVTDCCAEHVSMGHRTVHTLRAFKLLL